VDGIAYIKFYHAFQIKEFKHISITDKY